MYSVYICNYTCKCTYSKNVHFFLVSLTAIKPPVQSFSGALKSIFLGHTGGTFGSWRKCEKTLGATNYAVVVGCIPYYPLVN